MLLEGVTVIDLSRYLPGPYASMLLADLGAEVIMVEQPGSGDPARTLMPDMFGMVTRNKKSITLNLRAPAGKEILSRLVSRADVLLEGFRPGVAERLQIDYPTLSQLNPRLIYCSLSGFGQDGPYRDRPGHDINYLGISGALGIPGDLKYPPVRPGLPLSDLCGAMFAFGSILAALYGRVTSGKGQYLDVSLTDAVVSWTSIRLGEYLLTGKKTPPQEMAHLSPYNRVFETKDGKRITLGIVEEKFWQNFCQAAGREDLLTDPRHQSHQERLRHARTLLPELEEEFLKRDQATWLTLLTQADVPCGPAYTPEEVFTDPQLQHRGLRQVIKDTEGREISQISFPVKFSAAQTPLRTPPPPAGAHTQEILITLGYSPAEVASFREKGVL